VGSDGPAANEFVPDEAFDRLLRAWFGYVAPGLSPDRAVSIRSG
jgi:hypothetical protein